jgi:flagellar basal body-associated protein FliL
MGDSDQEPDPKRRVPTLLWVMLGVVLVVLFATAVAVLGGHIGPHAVGPPAGAP